MLAAVLADFAALPEIELSLILAPGLIPQARGLAFPVASRENSAAERDDYDIWGSRASGDPEPALGVEDDVAADPFALAQGRGDALVVRCAPHAASVGEPAGGVGDLRRAPRVGHVERRGRCCRVVRGRMGRPPRRSRRRGRPVGGLTCCWYEEVLGGRTTTKCDAPSARRVNWAFASSKAQWIGRSALFRDPCCTYRSVGGIHPSKGPRQGDSELSDPRDHRYAGVGGC